MVFFGVFSIDLHVLKTIKLISAQTIQSLHMIMVFFSKRLSGSCFQEFFFVCVFFVGLLLFKHI